MGKEINGKLVGLYYNQGTPASPTWVLAVCSTSDGFSLSTDAVTTPENKCDNGWQSSEPGQSSWSFSHSALANQTPSAGQISYKDLEDIALAKTVGQWKLQSTDVDDDFYWIGTGWISSLDETGAAGEFVTLDIEITGTGVPSNVEST